MAVAPRSAALFGVEIGEGEALASGEAALCPGLLLGSCGDGGASGQAGTRAPGAASVLGGTGPRGPLLRVEEKRLTEWQRGRVRSR